MINNFIQMNHFFENIYKGDYLLLPTKGQVQNYGHHFDHKKFVDTRFNHQNNKYFRGMDTSWPSNRLNFNPESFSIASETVLG